MVSTAKIEQVYKDSVPRGLYDEQIEKCSILEEVLKFSTAEQIRRDQETIKELTSERDSLKGQVDGYNKQLEEVKRAYDIAKRNLAMQLRAEKEQQLADYKKNTTYKKIRPLEDKINSLNNELSSTKEKLKQVELDKSTAEKRVVEAETLLKSRDEEIERLKTIEEKVDNLTELVSNKLENILDIVSSNGSREDIVEAVEKVSESIGKRVSTKSIEEECRRIHSLMAEGKTQKEIAVLMYPDLARREVKVTDRIKSKTYQRMFNEQNKITE